MRPESNEVIIPSLGNEDPRQLLGGLAIEEVVANPMAVTDRVAIDSAIDINELPQGPLTDMLMTGVNLLDNSSANIELETETALDSSVEDEEDFDWDALYDEHDNEMISSGVEVELGDGLDDLFVFETALDGLAEKPDDVHYASALKHSFDRIVESGQRDMLLRASEMLANHICNHEQDALNKGFETPESNSEEARKQDKKEHDISCKANNGGECNCKKDKKSKK